MHGRPVEPPHASEGSSGRVARARARSAAVAVGLAMALVMALPTAGLGATAPYSINLFAAEDFVSQTDEFQCIGASIQMMLNMVRPGADRTARTQSNVQQLARGLSWLPVDPPKPFAGPVRGASSRGWVRALDQLGVGPYILRSEATMAGAVEVAARAIRVTGKPVGLLVWRGRHAWVMTGFTATADPLAMGGFDVTSVTIADPWYPRNSNIWGRSPKPGSRLTLDQLDDDFLRLAFRSTGHRDRFLLVLPLRGPIEPPDIRVR